MRAVVSLLLFGLSVLLPTETTYRLALKDGSIVQFRSHRLVGNVLFYQSTDGKETSVSLATVDLDRTRELNASQSPPLELSAGLSQADRKGEGGVSVAADASNNVSLGEVARRLRQNKPSSHARRTLTNDDLPPARSSGSDQACGSLPLNDPAWITQRECVARLGVANAEEVLDFQKKLRIVPLTEEIEFLKNKLSLVKGDTIQEMRIAGRIAETERRLYELRLHYGLNYAKETQRLKTGMERARDKGR